jgi:DNA polymerase
MDSYHDTETYSEVPIKDGSFKYAEHAEVMVWSFALEDGPVYVWDLVNEDLYFQVEHEFSGTIEWQSVASHVGRAPEPLQQILDSDALVWFQNGGMFDFPVIDRQLPELAQQIPMERRRDTMVQFFAHGLPGSLEKIGAVLRLEEDERKLVDGKKLIHLFCKPQGDDFLKKWGTRRASKTTHPTEWQQFIEYAAQDIVTMRTAHKKVPMWNYRGHQVDLCHLNWKINERGFQIDMDLVKAAISTSDRAKAALARRTQQITGYDKEAGTGVESATQRDALLEHILRVWNVELPDLQSDTIDRRLDDPDLPETVKELLRVRLASSMNSVSKYKRLLRGVNSDNRLRGGAQFRGAGRTGRTGHRLFQHGNLPRPNPELKSLIKEGIRALKAGHAELVVPEVLDFCRTAIRGAIVAPPKKKLIVVDLANIEGRKAAWAAGELWKLQAFRDYDTIAGYDAKGKPLRKGLDLYIKAYAASFNVDPRTVGKDSPERQIGKVEELMFQYGGGVGAWITGAATYGIDLDAMTEAVWPTLPVWAVDEAQSYLNKLYEPCIERYSKRIKRGISEVEARALFEKEQSKARLGLVEKTWVTCDAIKRMWRAAHPAISSYWGEIEQAFRAAIDQVGVAFEARAVKIRRDGAWLRIRLPSGRFLCYLNPKVEDDGHITCAGFNQYTRKWERISTYGGKLFENIVQAIACDQLFDGEELIENNGYDVVFDVHDEVVCEVPDTSDYSVGAVVEMITADFGWNRGCPLAAAGFETDRYHKE